MLVTGKISVFINEKGYAVCVLKRFVEKKPVASYYIDAKLPAECMPQQNETLVLEVKESYLNVVEVRAKERTFTKLQLNVKEASVVEKFTKEVK